MNRHLGRGPRRALAAAAVMGLLCRSFLVCWASEPPPVRLHARGGATLSAAGSDHDASARWTFSRIAKGRRRRLQQALHRSPAASAAYQLAAPGASTLPSAEAADPLRSREPSPLDHPPA